MPEIKHVFNQGKMNKDLDERLVENGQYRDAMNIQVSTSEGSDVGTVQNILGNNKLSTIIPAGSTCVGAIADEKNDALYWFITSLYIDMIVEYKSGNVIPVFVDTDKNVLKFDPNNFITGINIIDNLLFWTDNFTEPKKINIDISKQGTPRNGYTHTFLIVPKRKITTNSSIKVREEHITVIKKSPKKQLKLDISAENAVLGNVEMKFADSNNVIYSIGEVFIIQDINITLGLNFTEGETLYLLDSNSQDSFPENASIRLRVVENISGQVTSTRNSGGVTSLPYPPNTYEVKVLSFEASITSALVNYKIQQGGNNEKFFEKKFVRFSYRYRYQDGEYSTFAPFSEIAFIPGEFNYETKYAYNTGMENFISDLKVSGFIGPDILEDVVQVDILYKESNSPVVYLVDNIKKTDFKTTNSIGSSGFAQNSNHWDSNSYEITSDIIQAALPANQLLRPWDNVPRKALAQEITGSRIVYGNYVQNYNIKNNFNYYEKPIISASYEDRFQGLEVNNNDPLKSLKSLRQYQLGITYIDEYGRETPVFTNNLATFKVPKLSAQSSSKISTSIVTPHPSWAKSFKFYIKETANEYYNLAMDKVYKAEDGNLWLSFPSSERNKIDEETFLILKKSVDSSSVVKEEAKYKVISIKNEAPEFIKKEKKLLLETAGDTSTPAVPPISYVFDVQPNATPNVGFRSFNINKGNWLTPILGQSLPDLESIKSDFTITFKRTTDNLYSEEYEVLNVTSDTDLNDPSGEYTITLKTTIKEKDNFIYKDLVDPNLTGSPDTTKTGLDTSLEVIINTLKIVERPEFEGKFFVKIENDDVSNAYAYAVSQANPEYASVASAQVFYLSDSSAPNMSGAIGTTSTVHSANITGGGDSLFEYGSNGWSFRYDPFSQAQINVGPFTSSQVDVSGDDSQWALVLDTGQETDSNGDLIGADNSWFIDQAHYRAQAPLSFNEVNVERVFQDNYIIKSPWGYTYQTYYQGSSKVLDFLSVDWAPGMISSTDLSTRALALQDPSSFKQGVYSQIIGGVEQWYIEISFSELNKFTPSTRIVNNGVIKDIEDLYDDRCWQLNSSEELFASKLKVGGIFSIVGDINEVKYVINDSPIIMRRFNHTGPFDWETSRISASFATGLFTPYANASNVLAKFIQPNNRRLTYKIPIKALQSPDQPLSTASSVGNIINLTKFSATAGDNITNGTNATQSKPIQFLFYGIRYDETERLSSDNPAIWETEPKENVDLDIYYEASQVYPISLNEKSINVLVSIGTTVTCAISDTVPVDTEVVSINNNIIGFNNFVSAAYLDQGNLFTFTDKDGAYVRLRFDGLVSPVEDGGGNSVSKFVRFQEEVNKKFGLSWNNCYSFRNGVESNRLRDDFNQVIIDKGAKASAPVEEPYEEERRSSGLIYSGLYNSTSGVNNLNQFIQAEKITKDLNPTYGSIQKLFSRSTDLIAFCEDRVIRISANKDAIFNADGNPQLIASSNVLGQTLPFSGDYGISKNPESFASDSYRAYFTDKQRGAVLRLSMDGLTAISDYGMSDYFGDELKQSTKLLGSYDGDKNEYNITLAPKNVTVSFDEKVKGWPSFKSFVPEHAISMANDYYTFDKGDLYKHHVEIDENDNKINRNYFYEKQYESSISVLLNDQPSLIKSFKTLNYEGSQSRVVKETTDVNTGYYNLINKNGWYSPFIETDKDKGRISEFIEKESKWFNFIRGNDVAETLDLKTDKFSFQGVGKSTNIAVDFTKYIATPPPPPPPPPSDPTGIVGCMNPNALNYNNLATVDDPNLCQFPPPPPPPPPPPTPITGCTNPLALNYDPTATVDDGSCEIPNLTIRDVNDDDVVIPPPPPPPDRSRRIEMQRENNTNREDVT
tara:strand:+ start:232 stop:5808 length:5577 start_codon:yes stop_codon:yes gene_type:complete